MSDITGLPAELRSNGIDVQSCEIADGVALEYMTAFPGDRLDRGEVGRVCNTFIDRFGDGEWEPTRVDATVVRTPGDVLARWHIEPAWIRKVDDGTISEVEFSTRVIETITYPDREDGGPEP